MNRLKDWVLAAALAMTLAFPVLAGAQEAGDAGAGAVATATATALLDAMDAGDYAAAEAMMTAGMAAAVPAARLQAVWESLPAQAGEARGRGEPQVAAANGATMVVVPLHYASVELVARIAVRTGSVRSNPTE